jgi:ABC-type amino acid transport substrate-binding protein
VSLVPATPERLEYLRYTESIVSSSWVMVVRKDASAVAGLQELERKEVGQVKGYAITDLAKAGISGSRSHPSRRAHNL